MNLKPDDDPDTHEFDQQTEELVARLDNLLHAETDPASDSNPYSLKKTGFQIGRFSIQRVIGSGGFGVVYLAKDGQLGRLVALKIPRPEVLIDQTKLKRFRTEATLAAKLDHRAIVPVYEASLDSTTPYIASAFCNGPNLMQWLERNESATVSPIAAAKLVGEIATAIHYAHQQGVVHRDLKPANIILVPGKLQETEQSDSEQSQSHSELTLDQLSPRVTDFGLAQLHEQAIRDTASSVLMGSPNYMAPEQAEGRSKEIGPHSDVFALGAILYQILTGGVPFAAENYPAVLRRLQDDTPDPIRNKRPDVSLDLETICLRCLEKNPADRLCSAGELAAELQRFVAGETILSTRPSWLKKMYRWTAQPARVPEAMMIAIAISVIRIVFAFFGLLLIAGTEVSTTRAEMQIALQMHLFVTLPCECFIIFAAFWNSRRPLPRFLWYVTISIMILWACLCFSLAVTPSLAPGWYQRNPGARASTFSLLTVLFASQAVCWWIGDWRRVIGRKRPAAR